MLITKEDLEALLKEDESPILEFKKQWYWDNSTPKEDMQDKWGEFLKDIISLSNGYTGFVGKTRYLIFGYSESRQEIHHVNISYIKQFSNMRTFKKNIIQRLEKLTKPNLLRFNISVFRLEEKDLLVFEIPSPIYLTELKQELKTKTRTLDAGSVLVRKGQKSDEIRLASPNEIININKEFEEFKSSKLYATLNEDGQKENIRERSIEKTVQLYIDKNSSYSLAADYPKKIQNWKDGIVYELYKLHDDFGACREFIYLHNNSNQGKTLGDITKNKFVECLSKAIILTDRPNIKTVEKRKENIAQTFGSKFVYFVDEFGYEFLYKDCMLPYQKNNLPIYVNGLYDSDDGQKDLSALDRLKEWFYCENEPLFVVNGHGGIGKTTLTKHFLDFIYDEDNNSGILFIDSKEIVDELSRNIGRHSKISDVYDFYKAQMTLVEEGATNFSRELLKLSMDNGSLIVVLDGIDEVIAKLGEKFDVDSFITSIFNEYSSDLNRTKVLITCRDHFWNEIGKSVLLPEIKLKAFNCLLAKDFFSQLLDNDSKKIKRAMDIASDLAIVEKSDNNSSTPVFIPFLLDMIGYLVNTKDEDFGIYDSVSSSFLLKENHTDFLVAKVCNREVVKLGSLDLDSQIELFIKIATNKNNGISLYDIKPELSKILENDVDHSLIEIIKGHPLLACSDNYLCFRYDVFNIYFKVLYLADLFRRMNISDFDEKATRIIVGYLKYDSSFTNSVCERIKFNDDLILFCIEFIESVTKIEGEHESLVSSIISLLLCLLGSYSDKQSNIESRTELVEKLFAIGDSIKGLCLVDIFGSTNIKPTIDFRNKKLINCTFNNFEYFWECPTNENTRFENSFFKDLNPRDGLNIKIWDDLFSKDCNTSSIQHLLKKQVDDEKVYQDHIVEELIKIFRLFYERGNFYPRKQAQIRKKVFAAKLLPQLLKKNVIKEFKDPAKPTISQYKVNDDYKSVINYIEQGSQSAELFRLAKSLND